MDWRGLACSVTCVLLGCGAGSDGDDPGAYVGTPDPSVTRPGPVSRPGSPVGSGGEAGSAAYAPGDRVDLGTADVVLIGAEGTHVGISVAMPGDMDGDGYAELVVANSSLRYDGDHAAVRHAVHVIYGGPDLSTTRPLDRADATLLTPWLSGSGGDQPFLAAAGDVDDDGLADLLVGVPGFLGDVGRTYLVYGDHTPMDGEVELADVAVDLTDGSVAGRFGARVAGLGDVNGDGPDDFAVAAWGPAEGPSTGLLYVFYGARARFADGRRADALITRIADDGPFPVSVAPAGNVDMDQYDDFFVVAGWPDPSAYLVRGSNVELAGTVDIESVATHASTDGGSAAAGIGDLDADGLSDFVVSTNEPVGQLFAGDRLVYREDFALDDGGARLETSDGTGWVTLSAAGDTNGDGNADFLVGLPGANEQRGQVYLVLGDGTRPAERIDLENDAVAFLGRAIERPEAVPLESNHDMAGASLGAGHDVNGDGLADFIIGAPGHSHGGADAGRAYVVFGISATP